MSSLVEREYDRRVRALTPSQRVERSASLLAWARNLIARQITVAEGPMSEDRLRLKVALRQYGAEPAVRAIIERKLQDVPD